MVKISPKDAFYSRKFHVEFAFWYNGLKTVIIPMAKAPKILSFFGVAGSWRLLQNLMMKEISS